MMIENEIRKNEIHNFEINENNLNNEIDSHKFFSILETQYGYSYTTISKYIDGCVYTFHEQQQFNITIRNMKDDYGVLISDTILFLEETMTLQAILKFIDDETKACLKNELSEKYFIKIEKNKLFDYCVDI